MKPLLSTCFFDNQAVYWRCKVFTQILSMQSFFGQGELWKVFFNKCKINSLFIIWYRMFGCLDRYNFKTTGQKLQIRYQLLLQCRQCVCTCGKYLRFNQCNFCIKFMHQNVHADEQILHYPYSVQTPLLPSQNIKPPKYQVTNQ